MKEQHYLDSMQEDWMDGDKDLYISS